MGKDLATFAPSYGTGRVVTAGSSSLNIELAGEGGSSASVCITNAGTDLVYIRAGIDNTIAATNADYPVLGGQQVTIGKFKDHKFVAYFAPVGSQAIHIMSGLGL